MAISRCPICDRCDRGLWQDIEPYIIKDGTFAFTYAVYAMKKPWPEAEPYIYIRSQKGRASLWRDYLQFKLEYLAGEWDHESQPEQKDESPIP
jgi:hypothetical protein